MMGLGNTQYKAGEFRKAATVFSAVINRLRLDKDKHEVNRTN